MNNDQIAGKWKQLKGSAKEQWGKLTDGDLDQAEGKRDKLVGKIQEKYGVAKQEAEKQFDAWASKASALADDSSYDDLREQIDVLKRDIAELSSSAYRAGTATARDTVARAREHAGEQIEHAQDQFESMMDDVETFTRERPVLALGLAAGAGYLLALTMSRR